MKKWINIIDRQLLERFPLLWITRAPGVLLVTLVIHLVFFALGWNVFKNPLLLQHYGADNIYIRNGALLLSIIFSVLIIVVWLIILFRHNAFKNYYPTSRWQLFSSFIIFFIVFLLSSTFYASYQWGYKSYIDIKYTDTDYNKKLDQANVAAAFLSFNQDDYTVDKKRYPAPFDTLYCEMSEAVIDFSKPYLSRYTDEYQFYTLKKTIQTKVKNNIVGDEPEGHLYSELLNDTTWAVWDKDQAIDVSALTTADPSYFNYSRLLFTHSYYDGASPIYVKGTPRFDGNQQKSQALSRQLYLLLKRNNDQEIRQLFSSFLSIAREFDIKTNLTPEGWLALVNRKSFGVDKFIYNGGFSPNDWEYDEQVLDTIAAAAAATAVESITQSPANGVKSLKQQYFEKGRTNYYFDASVLNTVFSNISAIKTNDHRSLLPLQFWLAFGLAVVLFIFRTSGLSALLFSIISGIVIAIAVGLVVVALNIDNELVISYLVFAIGTLILVIPLLFLKKIKKKILAVFINITLVGFVPYVFLILLIISLHQENYFKKKLGSLYYSQKPPAVLLDQIYMDLSNYLLITGFLFMLLYTTVVKKWKALPEG